MIRILHAADLHLDSPFQALGREKAALRRSEQRGLLSRMGGYGERGKKGYGNGSHDAVKQQADSNEFGFASQQVYHHRTACGRPGNAREEGCFRQVFIT